MNMNITMIRRWGLVLACFVTTACSNGAEDLDLSALDASLAALGETAAASTSAGLPQDLEYGKLTLSKVQPNGTETPLHIISGKNK